MVLFTSNRPLLRAENIKAVFDAYDGDKAFIQTDPYHFNPEVASQKYSLRVADEFIHASPGKAVMIGHGICGGKTFGLDQPRPYFRRENARLLTYVVATSEETRELVAHQCGVSIDDVKPLGLPRTDAYFGKHKGDGGTFLKGQRSYLYAPTWRTPNEPKAETVNWQLIDMLLEDDELLVIKRHMNAGKILDREYHHIVEMSPDVPSTPYLIDCDVLITDYSSIMLDAHVLGKPVVLFDKDLRYATARGMYLEYPSGYASRFASTEVELVSLMRTANEPQEEDRRCLEFTAGACDGHSTERVVQLIKGIA